MKVIITILLISLTLDLIICNSDSFCGLHRENGEIVDLSPLRLTHGYYTGIFFLYPPLTYSLFFNLCGDTSICKELSGNSTDQPCIFTPYSGVTSSTGLSSYMINDIGGEGVEYTFTTNQNVKTIIIVYCYSPSNTLLFNDCSKGIIDGVKYYKCITFSKYACPLSTFPPDPQPNNTLCSIRNSNDQFFDLTPLQFLDGSYFTASFFEPAPNSFNIFFNLCGTINICTALNPYNNYQSCIFHANTGYANDGGTPFQITEIEGGVNYQFLPNINSTTNVKIYCNPNTTSMDIYNSYYVDSNGIRDYQIYSYSKYACPDHYICDKNCSGNGNCTYYGCICNLNWNGTDCSTPISSSSSSDTDYTCFNSCSGNGECKSYGCDCDLNWTGYDCSIPISSSGDIGCKNDNDCSGKGECLNGVCNCFDNWTGNDCSRRGTNSPFCTFSLNGINMTTSYSKIICSGYGNFICTDEYSTCEGMDYNSKVKCTSSSSNLNCIGLRITCTTGDTVCELIGK